MNFDNLTFERLLTDAQKLTIQVNDSYIETYPEFLKFFKALDIIEKHHLIISCHFIYGWMPTIINIDNTKTDESLAIINKAKSEQLLNNSELEVLKSYINNSMVGTSKLLHFINPKNYAIWDSRICRYITNKKSQYFINKPQNYLNYLDKMNEIIQHHNFNQFYECINKHFNPYSITPMRAIEVVMFETDKQNNKS